MSGLGDDPLLGEVAFRRELVDGPSDAVQILTMLEQVKQQYIRSPFVREFTISLLRGLDNNDQVGQINRVTDWVKSHLTYVRDPVDAEYIVTPVQLIKQWQAKHYMAGDCDDHVLLLNTMLGTIGFTTKFVGVKFGVTDVFNHVICGIEHDGQLFLVDPCAKTRNQPNYQETLIL